MLLTAAVAVSADFRVPDGEQPDHQTADGARHKVRVHHTKGVVDAIERRQLDQIV